MKLQMHNKTTDIHSSDKFSQNQTAVYIVLMLACTQVTFYQGKSSTYAHVRIFIVSINQNSYHQILLNEYSASVKITCLCGQTDEPPYENFIVGEKLYYVHSLHLNNISITTAICSVIKIRMEVLYDYCSNRGLR